MTMKLIETLEIRSLFWLQVYNLQPIHPMKGCQVQHKSCKADRFQNFLEITVGEDIVQPLSEHTRKYLQVNYMSLIAKVTQVLDTI